MKTLYAVTVCLLMGCAAVVTRAPSGTLQMLSGKQLSVMTPVQVLQILKEGCCRGILVEPTQVSFWGNQNIAELQAYVHDPTPAAPVVSSFSSIPCNQPKFVSTVGREAKHLIKAIKEHRYPLANCSTYDLHLDGE